MTTVPEGFTTEEVDTFVNMAEVITGKAIVHLLTHTIEEGPKKGLNQGVATELIEEVKALQKYDHTGHMQLDMEEFEVKLNIHFTIAKKGFQPEITLHPDYVQDLYKQYIYMKKIATTYWIHWTRAHAELFDKICAYLPKVDFSELKIDPTMLTSLYFDPDCPMRISLFAYYVDKNGKIMGK